MKSCYHKENEPNCGAPNGFSQGLTPSEINFDHSKACIPTKVRPPIAVANISQPHIFLFFSFAYIDIDMLQREFNERVNNYPIRLDFTFSNVTTAIVQSNTYIPTLAETAEDALSPDTSNTSPQASIFQDLRGVFAASNRTLGGPNFATDYRI